MQKIKQSHIVIPFDLPPFGRQRLNVDEGNVALADCSAGAVQLIGDGMDVRMNIGSSMPLYGHRRYVRNPFSTPISGRLMLGLETHLSNPLDLTSPQLEWVHKSTISIKRDVAAPAGVKRGMMFMSRNSGWFSRVTTEGDHRMAILPGAREDFLNVLPAGVFAEKGFAFRSDGTWNDDLVIRHGTYTDADITAWIAAAGWDGKVIYTKQDHDLHTAHFGPDTAAIVWNGPSDTLEVNAQFTDLGSWNSELVV